MATEIARCPGTWTRQGLDWAWTPGARSLELRPKSDWVVQRSGDGLIVSAWLDHWPGGVARVWSRRYALSELPNDLIGVEDLKAILGEPVDGAPVVEP